MNKESLSLPHLENCTIAVIGLGYVGLPLAVEFATVKTDRRENKPIDRRVIGFDINQDRLSQLRMHLDKTHEINSSILNNATSLEYTDNLELIKEADVFIVTVPTPIDHAKCPDITALQKASQTVGFVLKERARLCKNTAAVVIYESTVYPGVTEDVCIPILSKTSLLELNLDFVCGYSPERINPGDHSHTLSSITKVTSGSNLESSLWIDSLYASIISAGTYQAASIKIAEAAKVIENTQRDLNIALVNELAMIFKKMNIDTLDVLEAAATKWNFLKFKPGLVGGHCIGVDPYYLTYKAQQLGYYPQIVLAGRRINDGMATWVIEQLVIEMARKAHVIANSKVLVLGFTFKENCPDTRNTKVSSLIESLSTYQISADIVDPVLDVEETKELCSIEVLQSIPNDIKYTAVILAVAHDDFLEISIQQWKTLIQDNGIFLDLKGIVPRELNPIRI